MKTIKILAFSFLIIAILCFAFLSGIYMQISKETSKRIDRGAIREIIFSESPVYYDDGQSTIGVYFEKIHSNYIEYKDIPKNYIKAIIASEDSNFFDHPGFDIKSIGRAFFANLRAGRVTQGGSTITQQTAKNIFKREKRTYLAKLKELIQALLLERRYSKQEILEMYINQFFVTGFGKGLMIASEYFFDKDAKDLDLVESAFLAGMVKGPFLYNPFTKKTDEDKIRAKNLAKKRKDYVLYNMYKNNLITEEEYLQAKNREVPFKEGKVTYGLNVILDYIRDQLESGYFRNILHEQGIDNIATSGIKIFTSIDKEIQSGALKSLRKQLPLIDVKLSGYNIDQFRERYLSNMGLINTKPVHDLPFFCEITEINSNQEDPYIEVSWDGGQGKIGYEGFKDIGDAWLKWKFGSWAIFEKQHIPDFLKIFHDNDHIPVRMIDSKTGEGSDLILSEIPELEGGIIVVKQGMIRAMVGGFFNRFFNRAADAKRQLGSIFKPIVYTAALQLKWNNLDTLLNRPELFEFQNTFYVPRPDHQPKSDKVSMLWAGTKSENIATVWLLYHLTDQLNMSEFRQVVDNLGLGRRNDESYYKYAERIRDRHGVVVTDEALMEAAFEIAKKDVEKDLIFNNLEDVLDTLKRLHFKIDNRRLNRASKVNSEINRFDFNRLRAANYNLKRIFKELQQLSNIIDDNAQQNRIERLLPLLRNFYIQELPSSITRVIYSESNSENLSRLSLNSLELISDFIRENPVEQIWLDNIIPSGVIDLIQFDLNEKYKELKTQKRYGFEILSKVRDFRVLVNLFYVRDLARELGITTWLDPVLSFPLGSNSISILEAAVSYLTMVNGNRYLMAGETNVEMIPIITKILDREDNIIYEYHPVSHNVISEDVSGSINEILKAVMENGTGRQANDTIKLTMNYEKGILDIPIPLYGKTGTANRFTNSSFIGYVRGLNITTGEFETDESYVTASYVGYDDNRPMRGKHIIIYGSSGALPLWIDTTNAIVNSQEYKEGIKASDLAFGLESVPDRKENDFKKIRISLVSGLPIKEKDHGNADDYVEILGNIDKMGDDVELIRGFNPISMRNIH